MNPFANLEEETKTEETAVDQNDQVEDTSSDEIEVEASTEEGTKTKTRKKRSNSPRKTPDQVKYIIDNYKDKTVKDLVTDPFLVGLTEQQIVATVKEARKKLLKEAEDMSPEVAEKIRAKVEEILPNRAETRGKRVSTMDLAIDEIKAKLLGDID